MKRFLFSLLVTSVTISAAYAAENTVMRATKLYEKRHYEEAAGLLRSDPASIEPEKKGTANLTLGMAYFKNAELHRELYQSAVSTTRAYLKKLSAAPGKDGSRFVDLYLGEALIEKGKPGVAGTHLEKFSVNESVEPRYRTIAKVLLGLSYYLNDEAPRANSLWATIDTADLEVKAELAAAYSRAGLAEKNPIIMADESLADAKKSGKPISMRLIKNILSVYANAGLTEKGLYLLKQADLKGSSYRETLGKSKIINFYDVSLLGDMATLYGQASVSYLEKASVDPQAKDAAEFYLSQAYALFGSLEQSAKVISSFTAASQMPQHYKDRIRVWQGANLYLNNRQTDALKVWEELSRKQPQDPDLLAEILSVCTRLKIESPKMARQAGTAVDAGEGKKFSNLNVALGKYYLNKLDNSRAVSYLEAGRDKSNKNKIESNDTVMLASLAEAYFRTKKFSEALEIYFEMSKQFPEVRQIQEAMQGVYSMEHRSAGDVKIN